VPCRQVRTPKTSSAAKPPDGGCITDVSRIGHVSVLATEVDDGVEGDGSAGGAEAAGPVGGADRRARHRDRAEATAVAGDVRQPPGSTTGGSSDR
jgi:hypothetical protein